MKNKALTLMTLSLFTFVLLAGLASAVPVAEWTLDSTNLGSAINVDTNVVAGTFTSSGVAFTSFDNTDGASAIDWPTTLDSSKYYEVTLSPNSGSVLTLTDVNFDYSSSVAGPDNFELKYSKAVGFASPTSIVLEIDVNSTEKSSLNTGLSVQVNSGETLTLRWFGHGFSSSNTFSINNLILSGILVQTPVEIQQCNAIGNPGVLDIKGIDFDNRGVTSAHSRFGSDDEWFPLEEIEVEIEIDNDGDFDIDDIEVEWGLWDVQENEWVIDLDDEKDFNLKDGKDEQLFITFFIDDDMDVDLDELDDGDHYRFYVIATGVIDDNNSPNDGEDTCVSDFDSASIIIENDFVVLDNIEFPEVLSCGETVTVTMDVWNIGDNDQDEVSVFVFNKDLDLREDIDVGDVDEFDSNRVEFTFKVPNGIEEKTYLVLFEVFDEDNDIYENDLDDDESEFSIPFRVGNCVAIVDEISVSASLISEAKAGQSLTVRVTITNNMFDSASFSVNAAGFGSWASSVQIDQPTVLLKAGESKDVLLTFEVASDAKGAQSFFVEILSEDGDVTRQPVQVDIQPKSLFGFTGSSILGGSNVYLWGIGLLNIILVVIIIIVAVRIARR